MSASPVETPPLHYAVAYDEHLLEDEVRPLFGEDRPPRVADRATPLETPTVGRWVSALEHHVRSAQIQRRVQVMRVPGRVECLNEGGRVVAHGWTISGT